MITKISTAFKNNVGKMIKKFFLIIFILIISIAPSFAQSNETPAHYVENARGIVLDIKEKPNTQFKEAFGENSIVQTVKIKILSGELKDKIIQTENQLTPNPAYNIDLKKGEKVILEIESRSGHYNVYVADKERSPYVLLTAGAFLLLLLYIGGEKSVYSVLSILIIIALIFGAMFPSIILKGHIIPFTLLTAFISIFINSFLVGGFNKKSLSAALSSVVTLFFATILFILLIKVASLSGNTILTTELSETLPNLDFKGILVSSAIIAIMGFVMEISMEVAAKVQKLKNENEDSTMRELFTSGIKVGQKIIGPKVNSLILAFLGLMLPIFLLFPAVHLTKFLNLNAIVAEIFIILVGSIAIITCVPISVIISGVLVKRINND